MTTSMTSHILFWKFTVMSTLPWHHMRWNFDGRELFGLRVAPEDPWTVPRSIIVCLHNLIGNGSQYTWWYCMNMHMVGLYWWCLSRFWYIQVNLFDKHGEACFQNLWISKCLELPSIRSMLSPTLNTLSFLEVVLSSQKNVSSWTHFHVWNWMSWQVETRLREYVETIMA